MTTLQPLHAHLIDQVFARAIAGDAQLLDAVGRFDGQVYFVGRDLVFTLPHLFRFLLADVKLGGCAADHDYKAFRRMLYASGTNAELRRLGAVVVVERAEDEHALSLYRLTRCRD